MKARHFILALKDYFVEHRELSDLGETRAKSYSSFTRRLGTLFTGQEDAERKPPQESDWALQFLEVRFLQGIMEAFDADSSGFITISEVNQFTSSRPEKWRLVPTDLRVLQMKHN